MSITDERNIDPVEEMNGIVHNVLDLASWNFSESYRSAKSKKLIFDSEWCRLSLVWGGWDAAGGNNIYILYGRLHAPNEQATMLCNGEESHCWHDIDHVLNLLDGLRPADAVKKYYSHPVTKSYYDQEFRQKFHRRQPEWLAHVHLAVWKHYGKRFFEIFDLRRPELWEQYQKFLKEFYDIKGRRSGITPPLDKVC